jgi:hypothetical protein
VTTWADGRLARWLPLLVFVLALAPRLLAPAPFVTWDEPNWTYRSLWFARALQSGRPEGTYLTYHPGVPTMWIGTAGVLARAAVDPDASADLSWVDAHSDSYDYDEDDVELLRDLRPWWAWARAAMAVATPDSRPTTPISRVFPGSFNSASSCRRVVLPGSAGATPLGITRNLSAGRPWRMQ